MVLDTLADSARYALLHPAFARAFAFLSTTDVAALVPGRHPIDGEQMYVSIDHVEGRGRDGARLEAHRRYIDIQYTIAGDEVIGWMPLLACAEFAGGFDTAKDVGLLEARPAAWVAVPPGFLAIFFPNDAHAPLGGRGPVRKAIVKVAFDCPR